MMLPLSANVSADPGACEYGEICLWENVDYNKDNTRNVRQFTPNVSDYSSPLWWNNDKNAWTNDEIDDETSSVKNKDPYCNVNLWQYANYSGARTVFSPGESDGNLSNDNIGDNRASSHNFFSC